MTRKHDIFFHMPEDNLNRSWQQGQKIMELYAEGVDALNEGYVEKILIYMAHCTNSFTCIYGAP